MKGERLIPVRSFEELRAGMIVVVKPCVWCAANAHRNMLLKYHPIAYAMMADGAEHLADVWENALPLCTGNKGFVTRDTVAGGRCFRVDDGMDLESAHETTRAVAHRRSVRT